MSAIPQHAQENDVIFEHYLDQLLHRGYCIVADIVPASVVTAISQDLDDRFVRTPFCEGDFYGRLTKRFGSLLLRSSVAATLIQHELILAIAQAVLGPWCDTIQLNLTQAIEIHPGAVPQFPHRDQNMWRGEIGRVEYLVNVIWPLTAFRRENGATLIWPDSHGPNALMSECPTIPVVAECDPGSAIIFLGSTLHGAGGNVTASVRRGIITSYCLGWLKPYENQWLVYPPEIARRFDPALAALVGYRQHRPNLGNYEGRCPSILLGDGLAPYLNAIDSLRPDQTAVLSKYVVGQAEALRSH